MSTPSLVARLGGPQNNAVFVIDTLSRRRISTINTIDSKCECIRNTFHSNANEWAVPIRVSDALYLYPHPLHVEGRALDNPHDGGPRDTLKTTPLPADRTHPIQYPHLHAYTHRDIYNALDNQSK